MNAGRPFFDAAALRATVGPGRVVAFGYSPTDLVGDWSTDIGKIIASNAVQWAAGHHMFQLAPWPDGKKAAAVMAIDVEADYQNARDALDALAPYKLPGTAFIVGFLAQADPVTTRRLVENMEIGTHTQRHLPLDTLTDLGQAEELANSQRIAEQIAGRPVTGFRPPEERFTPATLQIWSDLGGRYVFASNNGRAAGPEILPLLPDSLVLLGRVSEDDYEMLDRSSLRDRAKMSHLLVEQVGESIAYRGLYMFSYHSHMMSQKQLTPVLQELASKLARTPEVWTTTAGQVAEWWRARAAIQLVTAPDGRSATLTNTGPREFAKGILVMDAPSGTRVFVKLPAIAPGATVKVDADGKVEPVKA
jgi:peptidoglycan/xylan/chitin deacetylase (PgdA/CDA1 family)